MIFNTTFKLVYTLEAELLAVEYLAGVSLNDPKVPTKVTWVKIFLRVQRKLFGVVRHQMDFKSNRVSNWDKNGFG